MKDPAKDDIKKHTNNPIDWSAFTRTLEEIRGLPTVKG